VSAKISGKVWDADLPHAEAFVLLALADHADHNGENIYPGVGLIAWKTGYSDRQVQRIMESLIAKGILIPYGHHKNGQTMYKIDLSQAKKKPPYVSRRKLIESRKVF
jgi:hypothetical protein